MASHKHNRVRFGSNNQADAFGFGINSEADFIHGHRRAPESVVGEFGSFEPLGNRMQSHENEFDYSESDGHGSDVTPGTSFFGFDQWGRESGNEKGDIDDYSTSFSNEHLPTTARLDRGHKLDQLHNEDRLKIGRLEGQVKFLDAECKRVLHHETVMMNDQDARRYEHQKHVATMQQTIDELRNQVEELTAAADWVPKDSEPRKMKFKAWGDTWWDVELSENPSAEATIVDKVEKLLEQKFGVDGFKKKLEALILKTEFEISKQRVAEATSQMEALRAQYTERTSESTTPKQRWQGW